MRKLRLVQEQKPTLILRLEKLHQMYGMIFQEEVLRIFGKIFQHTECRVMTTWDIQHRKMMHY